MELWTRAGHIKIKLGRGVDVRKLDQEWAKYAPSFMDVARKLVERRVGRK